jgi:hypothetical protein
MLFNILTFFSNIRISYTPHWMIFLRFVYLKSLAKLSG